MSEVLDKLFSIENDDRGLDFIYEYLDTNLRAGNYELVDSLLRELLDNKEYWENCIKRIVYSLAFAIYIHHEPEKFSNRKEFVSKLKNGYIEREGKERADGLLRGLDKGVWE